MILKIFINYVPMYGSAHKNIFLIMHNLIISQTAILGRQTKSETHFYGGSINPAKTGAHSGSANTTFTLQVQRV